MMFIVQYSKNASFLFFVSEMCDSDEDVVLAGSALHNHLVINGHKDIEVPEKEKERSKQSTLSNELDVLNETCCENGNGQPDSNIRK